MVYNHRAVKAATLSKRCALNLNFTGDLTSFDISNIKRTGHRICRERSLN